MKKAFSFYIKVFSNLRIKDLCRKLNGRLSKTNTVGIRATTAVQSNSKGKGKGKGKKKRERTKTVDDETEDEHHESLVEIAESGLSPAEEDDEDVEASAS